jgi:hypothetical protein
MERNVYKIGKELFITSNEEIKEGDWCYHVELNDGKVDKCYDVTLYHTWTNNGVDKTRKFKKIILTTDQDLIKDGVQAIDDEFLEWFVKNTNCEVVEVSYGVLKPFQSIYKGYMIHLPNNEVLEEPKQESNIIDSWLEKHTTEEERSAMKKRIDKEYKDIQLEEAAEKYAHFSNDYIPMGFSTGEFNETSKRDFIAGANFQAERMYSEEEVLKLLLDSEEYTSRFNGRTNLRSWFEQFKKK